MPFDGTDYTETKADPFTAAKLREAADIIDQRGLFVGNGISQDGKVCTLGALAMAYGEDPKMWAVIKSQRPAVLALAAAIGSGFNPARAIYRWNDCLIFHPEHKCRFPLPDRVVPPAETVTRKLREVADSLESGAVLHRAYALRTERDRQL